MKKSKVCSIIMCIAMSAIMCLSIASCDKKDNGDDTNADGKLAFQAGIWEASVSGEVTEYFFFNDDGTSGNTQDAEMGIGVGFDFEVNEEKKTVVFHMGAADDNSEATYKVEKSDTPTVTLKWKNSGDVTVLKYLYGSDGELDGFYCNDDLKIMARNCYADTHKDIKQMPAMLGIQSLEDGMVLIQLYDNVDGHNSTAAWYEVDRFTGIGKNTITDEDIDFNRYYAVN